MAASNFKVIVVGGGPVGLTAAHALNKAGIDFLMLERRAEVVIDAGSNLVLSAIGLDTLAQLGLTKAIYAVSSPLGRIDRMDHSGRDLGDLEFFTQSQKITGVYPRVISRHDLTKVLYDTLPEEARQKCIGNKKLANITQTESGVIATCADGSSYSANAIVAADGAHSMVRDLMRSLAIQSGSEAINEEKPFLTTFRCLWVRFPKSEGLTVGMTTETHGPKVATQFFVGEDSGVIGVYERMDAPTKDRVRYTQADQDALIERWGHIPVTPGSERTLRDVYTSRLESGLVSLEEGVVDHWSWNGRIVLTGDAAHKFTPSTGAGCNNGMIDTVALINELRAVIDSACLESGNQNAVPSATQLATAFDSYQQTRQATVVTECARSGQFTSTATWTTGVQKFLDRRILSIHAVQRFLINSGKKSIAQTPKFNFDLQQNPVLAH